MLLSIFHIIKLKTSRVIPTRFQTSHAVFSQDAKHYCSNIYYTNFFTIQLKYHALDTTVLLHPAYKTVLCQSADGGNSEQWLMCLYAGRTCHRMKLKAETIQTCTANLEWVLYTETVWTLLDRLQTLKNMQTYDLYTG